MEVVDVCKKNGGIDVCINNAGLAVAAALLSGETDQWREMFDVSEITRKSTTLLKFIHIKGQAY